MLIKKKIATVLGDALIKGYQGFPAELSSELRVAATMKHFIGYGAPRNGQDRTTTHIPDRQLRQYHVPSFQNAVDIGVATVMECYNDVNGEPVVASKKYLKDLLRDEMGYEGMMVTDYGEINDLVTGHHTAEDTYHPKKNNREGYANWIFKQQGCRPHRP